MEQTRQGDEAQNLENTTLAESPIPTVEGRISISHFVDCPHCGETMYDDLDREWWNANITDQLPDVEAYKSKFELNCKECEKPFIIHGFVY
jgi:hypothetical protein